MLGKLLLIFASVPAGICALYLISPTLSFLAGGVVSAFVAGVAFDCWTAILSDESLAADLRALRKAYDVESLISREFSSKDVGIYYNETTDRDYKLLETVVGPGLHSRLRGKYPLLEYAGHTRQPSFVLMEISSLNAKNVLEIGFGRGYCTFYLAGLLPNVNFYGVDLVARHVEVSKSASVKGGYNNVHFQQGDATNLPIFDVKFDVIFGVEALCHMDTPSKMKAFIQNASRVLRPGGRLVIVDGFRSSKFELAFPNQQLAMELSECGFRIRKMPSKADWIAVGAEVGMKPVQNIDLTMEALPFWTLGWRFARAVLWFPTVVRRVADSSISREQTAANLLSVATTAHALRNGAAAEYGVLVLQMS